jgi:hypothetical protein
MNAEPTTAGAAHASPLPSPEEREALVLEFQRLAARLVQAQLISRATSARLVRSMNRERRTTEDRRNKLAQLVLDILLSVDDGTLKEGQHFVRQDGDRLALHLALLAPALFRAKRLELSSFELRSLLTFGWRHFRDVLVSRSGRARFGADDDRRRVVVLHEPAARALVGAPPKPVPFH